MNHIYKVIWNKTLNVWQAVSECAANNGKANKASQCKGFLPKQNFLPKLAASSLLVLTLPMASLTAFANNLPTGGQIQAGVGQINSSGQTMTINQASQNMVVDWQSFSIGKDASVNFVQPNAQAAALNRVLGDQVSNIRGALNANGQVFLVNPNGILFSPTARVDVGSLVSSTLNISNQNFMDGNYRFEGGSSNAVINQGNIQTLNGGTVAFIAAKIINTGSITTPKGNTLMGAGNKVVLDLGGPVKIEVEAAQLETYIEQGGAIKADGGTVYLTAKAANALTSSVINHTGITQAQTLASGEDGTIMLMGDMHSGQVKVAGTLDASAPTQGDGGFIETSAAEVKIDNVQVTTFAKEGKTGEWLIDPNDYTIAASDGDMTGSDLGNSLSNTNVTIESVSGANTNGNGDIFVNDEVSWSSDNTLTLEAQNDIFINKQITASGASGKLELLYGQKAGASENTADYYINAKVNLQAGENFITKLGNDGTPTTWTVVNDATTLQAMTIEDADVRYSLGTDIALTGTNNWSQIGYIDGYAYKSFEGYFDGLGHTISGLHIDKIAVSGVGLFGVTNGATIKNIGLLNAYISGASQVGSLVGIARKYNKEKSVIENTYAKDSTIKASDIESGGLIGRSNSTIKNSYAKTTVNGNTAVGGLVGMNEGNIINSYASGTITGSNTLGGLVGLRGTVSNSYYDNETNTGAMSDSSLGKTKTEILTAFTDKAAWAIGGGSNIEGYSTEAQLELPQLKTFHTPDENAVILFSSGFGTESNPYTITNWTQLQNINNSNTLTQNYFFSLSNNLDSSTADYASLASSTANSNKGWFSIGNDDYLFVGNFDGGNKTIADLYITNNTYNYKGLFGYVKDSTIKNIGVINANISGNDYVGALVGNALDSKIENIGVINANISGNDYVGALVGNALDSKIENSYATGVVSGIWGVGGLIGVTQGTSANAVTENSYARVKVSGHNGVGGLVGRNGPIGFDNTQKAVTIKNSYAIGEVSGPNHAGGLVGSNNGSYATTVINSFWDAEASTQEYSAGGVGKTTAQMQDKATFVDWGVTEDSTLPSTYLYPVLVTNAAGVTSWKIAKSATTSIKYTLSDVINNYIYNGTSQLPTEWLSSAIFGNDYSGWTLGTEYKLVHNATDVTGFKNAGTYANISVEVLKTGFVVDSTSKNGKFVIAPRPITVAADSFNKSEYTTDPTFTFKTSCGSLSSNCGLVTGERLSGALSRETGEVAGNYAIQQGSVNDPNYAITFEAGKLTIAAVDITPTPTPTPDPVVPEPIIPEPVIPEPVIPEPVIPEPVIPEPVIPEPVIPEPVVPEPVIPEPVIPEPVIPEPVVPDPVAPVVNPVEQIIAGIQQQPSNVFMPNNQADLANANPRVARPSTTTPTAAVQNRSQQSGNLELVELNETEVNAMANLGGNNSALLSVFVLQGGINLGNFNDNEQ